MPPKSAGQSAQISQSGFFDNPALLPGWRVSTRGLPDPPADAVTETEFRGGGSYIPLVIEHAIN